MTNLLDKDCKTAALKIFKKLQEDRDSQKKQCMNKIGISVKFNRWYLCSVPVVSALSRI